jgi:1,4-alpha-glucan branching enzyme
VGAARKKLLFQGGEIGQFSEWAHDRSVDWHLLGESPLHVQLMTFVAELNRLYASTRALHMHDVGLSGFQWSTRTTTRTACSRSCARATAAHDVVLCLFNCTPVPRNDYRVGVPVGGRWRELLNSDAQPFGGSGLGNLGAVTADDVPFHGRPASLRLTLPPLVRRCT